MKCTKVSGTLARDYANEHVCIFNEHVKGVSLQTKWPVVENRVDF